MVCKAFCLLNNSHTLLQSFARYREEVHPHATLPALVLEDGSTLLESSAICLYLATVFSDVSMVSMLPDGDNETAAFYK